MANVETRDVKLSTGAGGYEAKPAGPGPFPAVIVIQEWWGLNDHIKDVTRRLAAEGYVALAPDLYHGKVTKDPNEAGKLMSGLKQDAALADLRAAVDVLAAHPAVRKGRIGATGFCMGGRFALLLAAHDDRVKASAGWYGVPVPDDATIKRIKGEVLYIYGDQDTFVKKPDVDRLAAAMRAGGVKGRVESYPAPHAFFNDTRPDVYRPEHAKDAWGKVLDLFRRTLTA
jgi:carboxymethylenebutenolidase